VPIVGLVVSYQSNVFSCALMLKGKVIVQFGNIDFYSAENIRVPKKNGLLPKNADIVLRKTHRLG